MIHGDHPDLDQKGLKSFNLLSTVVAPLRRRVGVKEYVEDKTSAAHEGNHGISRRLMGPSRPNDAARCEYQGGMSDAGE